MYQLMACSDTQENLQDKTTSITSSGSWSMVIVNNAWLDGDGADCQRGEKTITWIIDARVLVLIETALTGDILDIKYGT